MLISDITGALPNHLTLTDSAIACDGGSVWLGFQTDDGDEVGITLQQRMFLNSLRELPGRLYWNHDQVPVRSKFERDLLILLKATTIPNNEFFDDHRQMLDEIITFVESETYFTLAKKINALRGL